ncbi:MAG: ATP-binding protein [Chloroflexi bacterium]|nr:ATP-binding protein [Chloroflexota bacterium]
MAELHLSVPARYDRLEEVTDFIARAARAAGLGDSALYHCQVAVDEACTNIILHGYGGEEHGRIEITCRPEPGRLTITLEDQAPSFDPTAIPPPDLAAPIEQLAVGGLGIHLIRQMMDEVHFQPGPGGTPDHTAPNRLILVKREPKS